jgi:eukaryotic-like serine/threonine-protein kinase
MQGVGPGTLLGGRYAVTLRTSEASSHERWRASDHTLEREVVLVCFPASSPIASAVLDAARRAAGVEDPRLVRVLDVGTDQGVAFVVEEPLTGAMPLSHLLQSGGLPAQEVRRLVGETASALDKASHRGLHHLALTPSTVLRMSDGSVKVRGLATEAVLTGADRISDEQASRADAVGLVKITYAGLTGRWPAVSVDGGLVGPGPAAGTGLEDAPPVVGGVAAPSEIVTGVPNDLDLICRMTLSTAGGRRGPLSPGDLAMQIAPWPSGPPQSDGASGIRLPAPREAAGATRVLPAVGAATGAAAAAGPTEVFSPVGAGGQRTREFPPASDSAGAPAGSDVATGASGSGAATGSAGATSGAATGATGGASGGPGLAAAGAAAAGAAAAIGDRVGSFARAAADKAAARAAERRAAHAAHDDFDGEEIALADALDEAPDADLEPPLPVFSREAPERPSGAQSRIALAIVGVLVLVALVIGINNVAKIGKSDGDPAARAVVTVTATRPPSSTSAPTTSQPAPSTSSQAPAGPVSVAGGTGYDEQDGTEADQNVKKVYDGDLSTAWQSRWYGTARYNGGKEGLGVILTLSQPTAVSEVELVLPAKQDVTVYLTNGTSRAGAQKVGSVKGAEGTVTVKASKKLDPGTNLIVFVTKAARAEAPNHYRAQITEVTVR